MRSGWLVPDSYAAWRDRLASGLNPILYSIDWLDKEVLEGRFHFCGTEQAAMVVKVKTHPTGVCVLHCVVAAGDMDEILTTLRPALEEIGADWGCHYTLVESYPVWAKKLEAFGYKPFQLTLLKEL